MYDKCFVELVISYEKSFLFQFFCYIFYQNAFDPNNKLLVIQSFFLKV